MSFPHSSPVKTDSHLTMSNPKVDSHEAKEIEERKACKLHFLHTHMGYLHLQRNRINMTKKKIAELTKLLQEETETYEEIRRETRNIFDEVRKEVTIELSDCAICLEEIRGDNQHVAYIEQCCHTFHRQCLTPWLKEGRKTCPMCRQEPMSPKVGNAQAVLFACSVSKHMRRYDLIQEIKKQT